MHPILFPDPAGAAIPGGPIRQAGHLGRLSGKLGMEAEGAWRFRSLDEGAARRLARNIPATEAFIPSDPRRWIS
jgi:hypothetical protein